MDRLIGYLFYYLEQYESLQYILVFLGYLLVISFVVGIIYQIFFKRRIKDDHSNWNTYIDKFEFSSDKFYALLQHELNSQGIKSLLIEKVSLPEGGILSSRRKYLRVTWKDFQYDICAAPFGKGFFISWWLLYRRTLMQLLVMRIPFLGSWLSGMFYPVTYYKMDTASMLMGIAQASVLKVTDSITKEKGIRIPDDQRRPDIKVMNLRKR